MIETNIDDKNTTGERIDSNKIPCISMRVKFSSINLFFIACTHIIVSKALAMVKTIAHNANTI
jgi:hypothetical protein